MLLERGANKSNDRLVLRMDDCRSLLTSGPFPVIGRGVILAKLLRSIEDQDVSISLFMSQKITLKLYMRLAEVSYDVYLQISHKA